MTGPVALTYADEFAAQTAFVTGGGSGIGRSVVRRLVAGGAAVAVADLDLEAARAVAGECTAPGTRIAAVHVDVTDPASVERALNCAIDELGELRLAVNSAGIFGARVPLADYPLETWRQVIDTDLGGVFYSMRYEIPAILAGGGGAIVNVSSALGTNGSTNGSAYVAAKHGVVGLTKAAALEYAERGIRINTVAPGYVDTPLLSRITEEQRHQLIDLHPAGRFADPDEVAELIVFLLSNRASFAHGGYHLIDGGYSAR